MWKDRAKHATILCQLDQERDGLINIKIILLAMLPCSSISAYRL